MKGSRPEEGSSMPKLIEYGAYVLMLFLPFYFILFTPTSSPVVQMTMVLNCAVLLAIVISKFGRSLSTRNSSSGSLEINHKLVTAKIAGIVVTILVVLIVLVAAAIQLFTTFSHPAQTAVRELGFKAAKLDREVRSMAMLDLTVFFQPERANIQVPGRSTRPEFQLQNRNCEAELKDAEKYIKDLEDYKDDETVQGLIEPVLAQLYYNVSYLKFLQGNYNEALRVAKVPIVSDADFAARMALLRSRILIAQDDLNGAEAELIGLEKLYPGDRIVLTSLGSVQLRKASKLGAKIEPDGHTELVEPTLAKLLDSSIRKYQRAIVSVELFPHYSTALYEHGPMLGIAIAKGYRRIDRKELLAHKVNFENAYSSLDFIIKNGDPNALRDCYLADRCRLTELYLELFGRPLSDQDYQTLNDLTTRVVTDTGRVNMALALTATLGESARLSGDEKDLEGISASRRRMEDVIGRFGSAIRETSPVDESKCVEEIARTISNECSFTLQRATEKSKQKPIIDEGDLQAIRRSEDRFDAILARLRESGTRLEYYMLLGWGGERRIILANFLSGIERDRFQDSGRSCLKEAIEEASRRVSNPLDRSNAAVRAIGHFKNFENKFLREKPKRNEGDEKNLSKLMP